MNKHLVINTPLVLSPSMTGWKTGQVLKMVVEDDSGLDNDIDIDLD